MTLAHLSGLVASYGYLAIFVVVLAANAGFPVPAAELLIGAAIYAAHTHRLTVELLILAGTAGAFIGGLCGFGLGRSLGAATLARFGGLVGLGASRLRLGQYLFLAHGGKIVFLLRFVALLGAFGGVLAGANRMPVARFALFNAVGGLAWTTVMAVGAYVFGAFFEAVGRPLGIAALVAGLLVIVGLTVWAHRREASLQEKADALLLRS